MQTNLALLLPEVSPSSGVRRSMRRRALGPLDAPKPADFHSSHAFDLLVVCTLFRLRAIVVSGEANRCLLSVGETDENAIWVERQISTARGVFCVRVLPLSDAQVEEAMPAIEAILAGNDSQGHVPDETERMLADLVF